MNKLKGIKCVKTRAHLPLQKVHFETLIFETAKIYQFEQF